MITILSFDRTSITVSDNFFASFLDLIACTNVQVRTYTFFSYICASQPAAFVEPHCKRKNSRIEMRPCFCESKNVQTHKNFDIHFLFLFYFNSSSARIKPETMLSLALISSIIFFCKRFAECFIMFMPRWHT